MLIKYRTHEVAKDFGTSSKEILAILEENLAVTKKHMTALEEEELNFIFDYYSQKNAVSNFDEFFASKDTKAEVASDNKNASSTSQKKSASEKFKDRFNRPNKAKRDKSSKSSERNITNRQQSSVNSVNSTNSTNSTNLTNSSQALKKNTREQKEIKIISNMKSSTKDDIKSSSQKLINTRATNVNIDKYNEKYDSMVTGKYSNDHSSRKQKINSKSSYLKNRFKKRGRHETEAERLERIAEERKAKPLNITVAEEITVGDLALKLKATAAELIKKLMSLGVMATVNDVIDFDTASLVAMEFHAKVEKEIIVTIEDKLIDDSDDSDDRLIPRAPVVVVMGHVDHGKTSLLDVIRNTRVTQGEAGGITQHIGAYRVKVDDRDITFLDTPGHEAFTTMRARGAQATDIAVLVVAADDGIMPQTVEAINHAKAAGVSIIVAINKMDVPGANPDQIKQQLTEYDLVPEEWGGNTPCILVSAKQKTGIDDLLEMIILVSDIKELKANPDRAGKGLVIEARLDKGRGPVATVLVQNGSLNRGDIIVAGNSVGRVRVMVDDKGNHISKAGPSVPVEIMGLSEVPNGGDVFNVVSDERLARELVDQRKASAKEEKFNAQTKVTLDNIFDQMKLGDIKELKLIVKADVKGSVEAVRQSLEKLSNNEVRVNVIHAAVGSINESDVMLACASNAIIIGFNVRPDPIAANNAERDGVDIRLYRVIYTCIEEIESAMKGMLEPKFREINLGRAECRRVFKISNVGVIAGSYVLSGKITRDAQIRVVRDGVVIFEDKISSLRRAKDDVKEVASGYECGIGLEKFNDIKEGDIFEAFTMEEYKG